MLYLNYFQIWGLFVGSAFVIGLFYILHQKKANPIDILNLVLLCFLGAIAGAKIFYFLLFRNFNGLVFYGGLFGGLLAGWIYIKNRKLDFWFLADLIAPAIALGIFIGRIGCFLVKDHQGIYNHPVALYLSLNGLILFFLLWFLKNKVKKGQLFIIFLLYYSLTRFLIDFLRIDPRWFGLTISQLTSIVIFVIVIYSCIKLFYFFD